MNLTSADVADSVRDTLQQHLPAVLAAARRPLPAPSSYDMTPTEDAIKRVRRVALGVITPALATPPAEYGDGTFDLTWLVSVAVWAVNTDATPLMWAAPGYNAAVREVLLTRRPELAEDVVWTAESFDLVSDGLSETGRPMGLGVVEFQVRTGSTLPPVDGDPTGPTVLTTDVQVLPDPL